MFPSHDQQAIRNLEKDFRLKEISLEFWRQGINPNDPTWLRLIAQGLNDSGIDLGAEISRMIRRSRNSQLGVRRYLNEFGRGAESKFEKAEDWLKRNLRFPWAKKK